MWGAMHESCARCWASRPLSNPGRPIRALSLFLKKKKATPWTARRADRREWPCSRGRATGPPPLVKCGKAHQGTWRKNPPPLERAGPTLSLTLLYKTRESLSCTRQERGEGGPALEPGAGPSREGSLPAIHCPTDVSVQSGQICQSKGLVSIDRSEAAALLSTTPRLRPRSSTNDLAPLHCMGWISLRHTGAELHAG